MHGNHLESAPLVESERREIVVRRHQPQSPTSRSGGDCADCVDESRSDTDAGTAAVQCHDLTFVTVDPVGDQTNSLALSDRHEARKLVRVKGLAVYDDEWPPPSLSDELPNPIGIGGRQSLDGKGRWKQVPIGS